MLLTTPEFEERLTEFLKRKEGRKRCEWCGFADGWVTIGPRSRLCSSCKRWRRREELASNWRQSNPNRRDEFACRMEYQIQYAGLCRESGQMQSWLGPISALELEWELGHLCKRFLREKVPEGTLTEFGYFSNGQRRLLMYMFDQITRVWLRNQRRSIAIGRALAVLFPATHRQRAED